MADPTLAQFSAANCGQKRLWVAAIDAMPGGGFGIRLTPGSAGAMAADARPVAADAVVLAVPASQAARLGTTAGLTLAAGWDGLGHSPIVNVHVIYERPVMDLPFVAAVDSPVQWVFDKTRQAGLASGQYLAVSLSAAVMSVPSAIALAKL